MKLDEFVNYLYGEKKAGSIEKAHQSGIIDGYESEHSELTLSRKDAARILHMYMKNVLSIRDIEDITPASVLKDLYDCRVCVNHIAQVYLRGIMNGHEYSNGLLLFDSDSEISEEEVKEAISKIIRMK